MKYLPIRHLSGTCVSQHLFPRCLYSHWLLGRYTQEHSGPSPPSWFFKDQDSPSFLTSCTFETTKICHDLTYLHHWPPGSAGPWQPREWASFDSALPPPAPSSRACQSHGPAWSNPSSPSRRLTDFNRWLRSGDGPPEDTRCWSRWSSSLTSHTIPKVFEIMVQNRIPFIEISSLILLARSWMPVLQYWRSWCRFQINRKHDVQPQTALKTPLCSNSFSQPASGSRHSR